MKRALWLGLAYGIGTFAFFAVGMNSDRNGWRAWYGLVQHPATTRARVTRVVRQDHALCYFEYEVQGVRYEDSDSGCLANVGDTLVVRYSPDNPSFATTRAPGFELAFQILACCGVSAIMGLLAALLSLQRSSQAAERGGPPCA